MEDNELKEKYWDSITKELNLLHSYLGITPDIDLNREVLFPYYEAILGYLNRKLTESINNGKSELKDLVEVVMKEFNLGADDICDYEVLRLKEKIGLDYENFADIHLAFTWGHVLTSLCTMLRMIYSYLFDSGENDDCCCCECPDKKRCCRNTTADYESWVSNVYPEDEEYDTANYGRVNAPWQNGIIKYNDCYRRGETAESICACGCSCCCSENNNNK